MNLAEVCRLCLVKSMKTSEELFFPIDEVFENKFSEITNFQLDCSEGFPSTVCISCVTEFEDFYNYRSGLVQKQKRLNLLLGIKEQKVPIKTETTKIDQKRQTTNDSVSVIESQGSQTEEILFEDGEQSDTNNENQEYENEHMEFTEESGSTQTELIFEEVLEEEDDGNEETYEERSLKQSEECIEEMEQEDEILFAIPADESNQDCIIVKTEDGRIVEAGLIERQKRKYVKQETEKRYKCWIDNCNAAFSFRSTMKKHMNQVHLVLCDRSTCLMCGRRFDEYSHFLNHVKTHTRKSECDICKLTFISEEKMTSHRDRVHKNDEHERCFQCPLCDASFKRKEHVNSHITYKHNTNSRKFPCKECPSTFLTRQDLKNHERSHLQVMKTCAYCPYECRDLKSIKLHCLKVHSTTRIYKCTCEEAFEMYKDYQSHKKNCFSVVDSTTAE